MLLEPDPRWLPAHWTNPGTQVDTRDGEKCIALADYAFSTQPTPLRLDDWQKFVIRLALARDATTGHRLYRQLLVSVGRQNGKSLLATALVLYGMLSRGDANVVGIASNTEQANIVYRRVLTTVLNNDSLKKRFTRLTETRALATTTGGMYKVLPSKGAALQGHTMSMVIADEVHLMKSDVYNATVIGAGQVPDSLVFSITTAGDEESHLLLDLYAKLREGTDGFGGIIWEADDTAAVNDLTQLKKANPALAEGRMNPAQVLQEVAMLPEPEARRYRLNRFIATEHAWLPYSAWSNLPRLSVDEQPTNPILVIDRTPDWSAATVAIAWKTHDTIYTDIVASLVNPDLQALIDLTTTISHNVPHTKIHMDALALGELQQALSLRGIRAERLSKRDHLQATSVTYQKIMEGKVTHAHHPMVAWQLARVTTKNVGDAYRLTRPNTSVEIDAATATVLAIYLAEVQQDIPTQVF